MASDLCFLPGGGRLSFYDSKQLFEAQCPNKAHGKCTLSRTCNGRRAKGKPHLVGGRPVDFMALWLEKAFDCPDKASHWSLGAECFSQEARRAMRAQVATMAGGSEFLHC
eukprot:6243454-Amphidinium_carterae.1